MKNNFCLTKTRVELSIFIATAKEIAELSALQDLISRAAQTFRCRPLLYLINFKVSNFIQLNRGKVSDCEENKRSREEFNENTIEERRYGTEENRALSFALKYFLSSTKCLSTLNC